MGNLERLDSHGVNARESGCGSESGSERAGDRGPARANCRERGDEGLYMQSNSMSKMVFLADLFLSANYCIYTHVHTQVRAHTLSLSNVCAYTHAKLTHAHVQTSQHA